MKKTLQNSMKWLYGLSTAIFNKKTLNFIVISLVWFGLLLSASFWTAMKINSKIQYYLFDSRFIKIDLDMRIHENRLDGMIISDFQFLDGLCRSTIARAPKCEAKYSGSKFSESFDCQNLAFCDYYEKYPITELMRLRESMYDVSIEVETYYDASGTGLAFDLKSFIWEKREQNKTIENMKDQESVGDYEFIQIFKSNLNRSGMLKKREKNYFSTRLDMFLDRSKYFSSKITLSSHFNRFPPAIAIELKNNKSNLNLKSVKLSIMDRSLWFLKYFEPYKHMIAFCFISWVIFVAITIGSFFWILYFFYYLADVIETLEKKKII